MNLQWLFRTHAIANAKKEMDKKNNIDKKCAAKSNRTFFQSRPVLSCPIAGFNQCRRAFRDYKMLYIL